jgi:heme/copper-type cytochrome/quinol oxidase subunit 1
MDISRLTRPQRLAAVAVVVIAISAFLPWASVFGISVTGIHGDGQITLICALVGGVLLALRAHVVGRMAVKQPWYFYPSLVLAAIVALVGLFDLNNVAALGLYLTFFGGIAWLVALIWERSAQKKVTPEPGDGGEASLGDQSGR